MLVRTHLVFAVLCAIIIDMIIPISNRYLFYGLIIFGALLPDIDHKGSTINKILPITDIIATLFKHRGFFHSIFPIFILYGISYALGYPIAGIYVGIGYFTHLISDAFTKLGVNFLHPFSRLHARGFIEVGTFEETVFFVAVVAGIFALLLN